MDDALAKLRQAAKTDDPEVRRRAEQLVELITKRLGDKAVQELLTEVNKEGVDRFIDRMATAKDYATAERWDRRLQVGRGGGDAHVQAKRPVSRGAVPGPVQHADADGMSAGGRRPAPSSKSKASITT